MEDRPLRKAHRVGNVLWEWNDDEFPNVQVVCIPIVAKETRDVQCYGAYVGGG